MHIEEMEKAYRRLFSEATAADEQALMLKRKGQYPQAAQMCAKAASLYAQAANALIDISERLDGEDRLEVEKSVDRLIGLARQLKEAARSLKTTPAPAKDAPLPAQGDEEDVAFAPAQRPTLTFADIAGLAQAKQTVMDEIINPMLYGDLYDRFHVDCNGGLLLFGPPGGGKTMMARAIAAQANLAFFSVRCSDIVGKYFGEAEKHVRALFRAAREAKDAVIFMDEAEALACRRGSHSTVMNRLVPELLSQMDGFERFDGRIIVIFATNRPYDLDPAFLRPGRLPHHCYIPLPDLAVRRAFLTQLLEKHPCQGEIDIQGLAERTARYSCADLANLVKRGCQRPINRVIGRRQSGEPEREEFLTQADLDAALATLHPSVEPEDIRKIEKWMRSVGMTPPEDGERTAA